jgi:DNA modification methylase
MIDIKPYSKNAKKHPDKQLKQIANSLKEFGWQQPIVVDKNGVIIVGHGRWFAYQKYPEGIKEPEIKVADLTEEQAKAYRLADNKLNESEWDIDLAIEDLKELSDEMFDLTGFDKDLLIEPDEKDDLIPENPPVIAKLGDIWQLGRHRLMCGDSTDKATVELLMDGKKADMVFTDPPYGVDYEGINNDSRSGLEDLLTSAFENYKENCIDGASVYCFHSDRCADIFHAVFRSFCHFSSMIIWEKQSLVLSQGDYQSIHEPCLYGWFDNGTHRFFGDRKQTSIWQFDRKSVEGHTTPKPIGFICKALGNSSKRNEKVLDLFGGSGSTLIACEKTNRICYGMEIDPHYCDVIIKRWEDYTGNKATKIN